MSKNAVYLAKNVVKNQTFFEIILSGKLIISLIRKVRLPFSNADSEAGHYCHSSFVWCVIAKMEKSRHLTSFG